MTAPAEPFVCTLPLALRSHIARAFLPRPRPQAPRLPCVNHPDEPVAPGSVIVCAACQIRMDATPMPWDVAP